MDEKKELDRGGTSQLELGERLQALRKRCGLSIRELAREAGVTAGMISCVERGKNSPSIVFLQKILYALETDLATFFANGTTQGEGPVYPRERMSVVSDLGRHYTIVFPRADGIRIEMLDEQQFPREGGEPEWEILKCDVGGCVLSGSGVLEIKGEPPRQLRTGDAFYVPMGTQHRGYATGDVPMRLITVYSPPRY
jgi:transcriptional regulator with XRE-family HTH domain